MAGDACLRSLVAGLRGLGFLAERVTDWKDGFAIFLSTIECRGRHENEQPKVGPKAERLGRSESNYADYTDSSAFLGSLSRQVKSMCYLKVNN